MDRTPRELRTLPRHAGSLGPLCAEQPRACLVSDDYRESAWIEFDLTDYDGDTNAGELSEALDVPGVVTGTGAPPTPLRDLWEVMTPAERKGLGAEDWRALWAEQRRRDEYDAATYGEGRPSGDDAAGSPEPAASLFVDLTALDASAPIEATVGRRADGRGLLYPAAVNGLIGDPEQGKSLLAAAIAVEVARADGVVVWLDLDHNGSRAFRSRVESLGGGGLLQHFRFAQPDDREGVTAVTAWAIDNAAALYVVDSIGELLPMFGANSDNADDYTRVHRAVLMRAARAGVSVLTIDHLAKGSESRAYGSTGTIAKKRAIDGALYRVDAVREFSPARGGEATLRLIKDRHGSVRSALDAGREPIAAMFEVNGAGHGWALRVPLSQTDAHDQDVAVLLALPEPPKSQNDVRKRLNWGGERSARAFREWQRRASGVTS